MLETILEMFPEAPVYTLMYDKNRMRGKFEDREIHTSFLQKFPGFLRRRSRYLLPFIPTAPETFNLRDFDVVISSSGAWCKGLVTRLNVKHICYMHSPMRFAWDSSDEYIDAQKGTRAISFFARVYLNYLRMWDKVAADRPDYIIANSRYTQERIRKYYRRESAVIYPPACIEEQGGEIKSRELENKQGYFLMVSRLSPYKNAEAVIEAFNKLELPLVVVGEGAQEKYLRSIASKHVTIAGWKDEKTLKEYYKNARACLFPSADDFGIVAVEAMSYGIPVLAIRKGGVREIIVEGKTGEFFDAATPEVIADGVRRFTENKERYDGEYIRSKAKEFSKERFMREFGGFIEEVIENEKCKYQNEK